MKIKQVTNLLVHVKNRFAPMQSPALKQAAGVSVQSGLKAGASNASTNDNTHHYVEETATLSLIPSLLDDELY